MNSQLIMLAAGRGRRLGYACPKALVKVAGRPLVLHALARFAQAGLIDRAVVTVPGDARAAFAECVEAAFPQAGLTLIAGGEERQDSVALALAHLDAATDVVAIHDAARAFVEPATIQAVCQAAADMGAATAAQPCSDTILVADAGAYLEETPPRARLWACQTPQAFRRPVIERAYEAAAREGFRATDDATLARWSGARVKLVKGAARNFKVTTPIDLALAELVVKEYAL